MTSYYPLKQNCILWFAYVANPIANYLGDPTATNFDASSSFSVLKYVPIVAHARAHINRLLKLANIWVCLKIVYPYTQWLMIIIPTKWLFHWGYTPFSDIPI